MQTQTAVHIMNNKLQHNTQPCSVEHLSGRVPLNRTQFMIYLIWFIFYFFPSHTDAQFHSFTFWCANFIFRHPACRYTFAKSVLNPCGAFIIIFKHRVNEWTTRSHIRARFNQTFLHILRQKIRFWFFVFCFSLWLLSRVAPERTDCLSI